MSATSTRLYAGDVSASEAFERLRADPGATLIDVRTQAEWSYVGLPLIDEKRRPLLLEWQSFPSMEVAADFAERLSAELGAAGVPADAPLFFICRSGARSRSAAIAMTAAGRSSCFNVAEGFEGPRDAKGHRGTVAGWKAEGLPWVQS